MADQPEPAGTAPPEGLGRLWTPWRMAYVGGGERRRPGCPFCIDRDDRTADADDLVLHRGTTAFCILNAYPYNPGHLMVVPYRHIADYADLSDAEAAEVATLTRLAVAAVRATSAPDGFNLGVNVGEAAGAGIAAHLHQHVVPRWSGDTNFMPVVGRTRVLPQVLADTRDLLAPAFAAAAGTGGADGEDEGAGGPGGGTAPWP